MDLSIDIVDLLGQASAAIPVVSSFQPIFGALKLILQRAQKLSDDKKKLATLAVRSTRLSLTLHEQMNAHADHLGDRVKVKLDEINGIIDSILSEFKQLDKKPTWRHFSKSKNITDKVSELYDELKISIDSCQLVLGVDTSAKLTRSSNVIDQAHQRICDIETRIVQHQKVRNEIDPDSNLEIISRSELCLQQFVDTRYLIKFNTQELVTITTFEGLWRDVIPVQIKRFQSAAAPTARHAFEMELSRCKDVWSPFLSQPRGHSNRESLPQLYNLSFTRCQHSTPFYHSPRSMHIN